MIAATSAVVDASVIGKWFFPDEDYVDEARDLLDLERIHVPDLMYAELGNALWKRIRRDELTGDGASAVVSDMRDLPVTLQVHTCDSLLLPALHIAESTGASVYDSMYVALAKEMGIQCVTADRKLYERLQDTSFVQQIAWIGD